MFSQLQTIIFADIMHLIEKNIDKISALCRKYKVAKLWVFGSILTPRFNDQSDIDFSVLFDAPRIDETEWADIFFGLIDELSSLVGRKVDMVCDDAVRNPYFREELDNTKRLIYG